MDIPQFCQRKYGQSKYREAVVYYSFHSIIPNLSIVYHRYDPLILLATEKSSLPIEHQGTILGINIYPMNSIVSFLLPIKLQYRSEISGQRTRKTHTPFLRKCVLKNACFYTRLRAFDARVFFCYSLTSMAFFSFFSQQKARQKAVPTNTAKNNSANKEIADTFLAVHMVLTNVRLLLEYFFID